MNNQQFTQIRECVIKEYEVLTEMLNDLIAKEIIAKDSLSKKDADHRSDSLKNNKFIVSVCGQINAGKSTLLNALLFGDDILPSDDTPHTAKLAKIEWAEKPYFEVEFYTEEEWKDVKQSYNKEAEKDATDELENFKKECNVAVGMGIHPQEVLGSKKRIEDLDRLKEYVSVVGKDDSGIYTPFVKCVNLYYPAEILKDITIVDTPGINDPNVIRSKVTTDWIKKSHAVVYAIYANSAFDQCDVRFVEEHLSGIRRDRLVYAVNKIDSVTAIEELDGWLKKIRSGEFAKQTDLFQDEKSIQKVSGLGRLLQLLSKQGKSLPEKNQEKYQYYFSKLQKTGIYLTEKNGMQELEILIKDRVIKVDGKQRLQIDIDFIVGNYKKAIREVAFKSKLEEGSLLAVNCSVSELKEIQKDLDKQTDAIFSELDKLREGITNSKTTLVRSLHTAEEKMLRTIKGDLEIKLLAHSSWNALKSNLRSNLNESLRTVRNPFSFAIEESLTEIKYKIDGCVQRIRALNKANIPFSLTQDVNNQLTDALYRVTTEMKSKSDDAHFIDVDDIIESNTTWWGRFWGTREALNDAREGLRRHLSDLATQRMDKVTLSIEQDLEKILDTLVIEIYTRMNVKIKEIDDRITKGKAELNNKKQFEITTKAKIEELSVIKTKIEDLLSRFEKETSC